jgi:hypothetical protein
MELWIWFAVGFVLGFATPIILLMLYALKTKQIQNALNQFKVEDVEEKPINRMRK